ncbi:MAG TPA: molecular chaperone HtpG [Candidatus Megaira endosymbiont of Nemacystus decipiens]|nr:molecular chaperone HtpG [Candidatus Megaera endosymbiont of Nemacystus decipiens]
MTQETKKFDAEIGKVLNLMIHSLYTNKEIFLRELISNASDACDKLRYLSQTDEKLLGGEADLNITVSIDKDARTITVRDTGIGMNKDDLNANLGTIASSGTQRFLDQLSGDSKKDNQLIGQFGVGFYSSFMVADRILVTSKKAGENEVYTWSSDGQGEYIISDTKRDFARGTEIVLHMKTEEDSFLDHFKIKHIIKSYSDHISIPIYFLDENGSKTQTNSSSAIWTKSKSDLTNQQYNEFYKSVAHAVDEPWITMHNHNEGLVKFINLIFIPSSKTFDLFHPDRKCRIKLYIKKVFIADENIDLIPQYMRFLRGVVDSDDLPLNISRETLQHNSVLEKIKQTITNKVIAELKKQKQSNFDKYLEFWNNFGGVLKEGLCEVTTNHEKLLEVCVFKSALHNKMISLDDYIANCKDENKTIYYLSGDDAEKLRNNPQIEGFLSKKIDVLLFTDTVDDFWVNVNSKYKDVEIKSVTRSDINLNDEADSKDNSDKKGEEKDENFDELTKYFKESLNDLVRDVKISKKLQSTPACLAVADGSMDIRMERYLIEQKQLSSASAKILEINPKHKIVAKINKQMKDESKKQENKDLVYMLYDQACIIEGQPVSDVALFSKRLNNLFEKVIL